MTSLPKTFKQAVFKEAGAPLTIEDTALTLPGNGDLLVKVEACGVCASDVYAQAGAWGGGFPFVPGHEYIGHVAAVGNDVSRWRVGDRVGGGWHGGHDGTCPPCKKGFFQMCNNRQINGETKWGGYAEYCLLQASAAVRIPSHIPASQYAPILCAGLSSFNSLRHMNVSPGSTVAIQGVGGLGHLAIQYASKSGYRVVAISRGSSKEKIARELGAHEYIDASNGDVSEALQKFGGASLVVVTANSPETINPLITGLGVLGKVLFLAVPGEVKIDTLSMLKNGLSIQVWPSGHATDAEEALAFTELENIQCMVETFPLAKANEAFNAMVSGKVRFRAVITMD